MKIAVSLIPILLFLAMFLSLDSFRLIRWGILIVCLLWGGVAATLSLVGNTLITNLFHIDFDILSRYIAPLTEEILKMLLLLWLITKHRIGFAIDAAIYGFTIGTGFAFAENMIYIFQLGPDQTNLWIWVTRGFGTAIMHGGVTAIAGIILVNRLTDTRKLLQPFILAVVVAYLLHALYNAFFISPLISALIMMILIPATLIVVFRLSTGNLKRWLDMGMDAEVELLLMINKGKFSKTRAGKYLLSIKDHFPREVVVDMYCYSALYLELSVKAKCLLLLKESDLPLPMDPQILGKLEELELLQKNIGKSGILALKPILRTSRSDLWALTTLKPNK